MTIRVATPACGGPAGVGEAPDGVGEPWYGADEPTTAGRLEVAKGEDGVDEPTTAGRLEVAKAT